MRRSTYFCIYTILNFYFKYLTTISTISHEQTKKTKRDKQPKEMILKPEFILDQ